MDAQQLALIRNELDQVFRAFLAINHRIQIWPPEAFPYGWGSAAKGRTVWRILEELVTQNLIAYPARFGLQSANVSGSEVSIWDLQLVTASGQVAYVNIKSSVRNARTNKDDISKAQGLHAFFSEDPNRAFFIVTFELDFQANMAVAITNTYVMPIAWLPDVYVNPSNNGNLQSSAYKDVGRAIMRSNHQFLVEFQDAWNIALDKKRQKALL